MSATNYIEINKQAWNSRTGPHLTSAFYDVEGFVNGASSLHQIERDLIGDVKGKSILHLQCHFGQDTLSLGRLGATVTGVDLSDKAIEAARALSERTGIEARFICCDLYELPNHLDEQFDMVYTSYGTIGWLPDINRWAAIVARFLKPGGTFFFAEFHPVVWMFDNDFEKVAYNYFNSDPIIETESGTYADKDADITNEYITWNHGMGEVIESLLNNGLQLLSLKEYDYSPHNCFKHTVEVEPKKFRIQHLHNNIPMVYALSCKKLSGEK